MSVAAEYQRQFAWRDWHTILAALPELQGQTCSISDAASETSRQSWLPGVLA